MKKRHIILMAFIIFCWIWSLPLLLIAFVFAIPSAMVLLPLILANTLSCQWAHPKILLKPWGEPSREWTSTLGQSIHSFLFYFYKATCNSVKCYTSQLANYTNRSFTHTAVHEYSDKQYNRGAHRVWQLKPIPRGYG